MFFTRNVANKLQQDTYIQRARMFGARGEYLEHFELTIPAALYANWHKCFVFHKLALATIKNNMGSPVWIGDGRISVVSAASINKATVALDKGEMSFQIFDYSPALDKIVLEDQKSVDTLRKLADLTRCVKNLILKSCRHLNDRCNTFVVCLQVRPLVETFATIWVMRDH